MENGKRSALILEGGAMRGLFTSGILDVFLDEGITFDTVIGVSAGAAFGCNYKSKQKGRVLRYNLRFRNDWRYSSLRSLLLTGNIFGAEFCYDTIPNKLDIFDAAAFKENPMEFIMVATEAESGKPYYYKAEDGGSKDLLWMRASASMPIVSRAVEIDGKKYLDGGISDPIPYHHAKELGFDKIAVVLTQPIDYIKKNSSSASICSLLYQGRMKGIANAMKKRADLYNRERDEIFEDMKMNKVFVIAPDRSLGVGHIEKDEDKLKACYECGAAKAKSIKESLKEYLAV